MLTQVDHPPIDHTDHEQIPLLLQHHAHATRKTWIHHPFQAEKYSHQGILSNQVQFYEEVK